MEKEPIAERYAWHLFRRVDESDSRLYRAYYEPGDLETLAAPVYTVEYQESPDGPWCFYDIRFPQQFEVEFRPVDSAKYRAVPFPEMETDPLADATRAKDAAYAERNRLIALLAAIFPSSLEPTTEPEEGWSWICFVDLPTGQATWHIPDGELRLFGHVSRTHGRVWDGHTTEQKYRRIADLAQGLTRLRATFEGTTMPHA